MVPGAGVSGPPAASPPARRCRSSSTHSRTRSSSAATLTSPVTSGAIAASHATASAASPSSQAPPSLPVSDANARRAAHRARTCAVHCSCKAESPSSSSRSASEICTHALTGCPARSGSSPLATSRRIASASASWYRCSRVRSSSFPAGAPSASSTRPTTSAHSGVRSPWITPAPPNVTASFSAAVREVPVRVRVRIRQLGPGPLVHLRGQRRQLRHPQPARRGRQQQLVGLVPELLRQPVRPQADQPPRPTPGPARRPAPPPPCGWVRVRPAQAACPTAAPLVIPVRCISHDTALYSASPA